MSLPEEDGAATRPAGLFARDTGELPLDTRRVLVLLLLGPSLDVRRHSKLWPVLLRDEEIIRRRLHELFMDLEVDRDLQIAFTRQPDTGDLDTPTLLRRVPLTFLDSVLLLSLRHRLTQAVAQGDRAAVSAGEIHNDLAVYERAVNTDRAGFQKRVHASIEKMKKYSVLQKIRAEEDRFEISPALKLLFPAEEIQALTGVFRRLASGEPMPGASEEAEEKDA